MRYLLVFLLIVANVNAAGFILVSVDNTTKAVTWQADLGRSSTAPTDAPPAGSSWLVVAKSQWTATATPGRDLVPVHVLQGGKVVDRPAAAVAADRAAAAAPGLKRELVDLGMRLDKINQFLQQVPGDADFTKQSAEIQARVTAIKTTLGMP